MVYDNEVARMQSESQIQMKLWRYVDTKENRARLYSFYRGVYPDLPWLLNDKRFEWQTFGNPLKESDGTEIWLLLDEQGEIIGQNIYILYNLTIDGQLCRGYCSTNMILKPSLVGKGLGHKFIELNESRAGIAYAVGITPASARAFQKYDWVLIENARLYNLPLRPIPNLRYIGMPSWKQTIAAPILSAASIFFRTKSSLLATKRLEGLRFREIYAFDQDWDRRWQECLRNFAIYFQRTSNVLNYKFFSRQDVKHTCLLFEAGGIPVGYAVYRLSENPLRGIRLGRIVDLVYEPNYGQALLEYMLYQVKVRLWEFQVDGLVGIAANNEIAKAYRANGFFLSRVQPAIIKPKGFELNQLRKRFNHLWYITLADSDLDNYW